MPRGFHLLIAAQFASALADNGLLIVTIALLQQTGRPGWWAPMLKMLFIVSYVLLAPVVGPLADAIPKARLMAWMNGLKCVGVVLLCAGTNPLPCFAIIGLGAAAYAPAKYGLLTELVPPARLVSANAWIETSVVGAVLAGTVLGGVLVGPVFAGWMADSGAARAAAALGLAPAGTGLGPAFALLLAVYGLAAALNLGIPDSGARYAPGARRPWLLGQDFLQANLRLWRDRDGGLSMAVTTLFWGAGAVLQFAVLRWAADVLGLALHRAATLQAVVAFGVVAGAGVAGRWIGLRSARRVLPAGIALGGLIACGAGIDSAAGAWVLMTAVGLAGGILVVPMNALLQHRGHRLLTAGRSIAVQGFNENLAVLLSLGVYATLLHAGVPIVALLAGMGLAIATAMTLLTLRARAAQADAAAT